MNCVCWLKIAQVGVLWIIYYDSMCSWWQIQKWYSHPFLSEDFVCAQVNEAEEERLRSEREHQRVTQLCQDAEARVQTLQKTLKKVILKSKPYFELKAQFNHILEVSPADVFVIHQQQGFEPEFFLRLVSSGINKVFFIA